MLWILETPGKPKRGWSTAITGMIAFCDEKKYASLEEWNADRGLHCIEEHDAFDWDGTGRMYGWYISHVEKFHAPIAPPNKRGMVGCKKIEALV